MASQTDITDLTSPHSERLSGLKTTYLHCLDRDLYPPHEICAVVGQNSAGRRSGWINGSTKCMTKTLVATVTYMYILNEGQRGSFNNPVINVYLCMKRYMALWYNILHTRVYSPI